MADAPNSENTPAPRHVPDELAAGLDLFITAWLEQWADAGGSVILEANGRAQIGFPEYHYSPAFVEPAAELSEALRIRQDVSRSDSYHGKMRGMVALIEAVPCGYDALKDHMRAHGMRQYFGQAGADL